MDAGVTAVLDLSDAFSEARPFQRAFALSPHPRARSYGADTDQMFEAAAFIEEHATNGTVYVHCKIGYSRSAAVVAAWLLQTGRATSVDKAVSLLRRSARTIVIRPEIAVALANFADAEKKCE